MGQNGSTTICYTTVVWWPVADVIAITAAGLPSVRFWPEWLSLGLTCLWNTNAIMTRDSVAVRVVKQITVPLCGFTVGRNVCAG